MFPQFNQFFFLAASAAAFLALSAAIFLLVLEINQSIPRSPTIKAKAGNLNRQYGSKKKLYISCFRDKIGYIGTRGLDDICMEAILTSERNYQMVQYTAMKTPTETKTIPNALSTPAILQNRFRFIIIQTQTTIL